MKKSLAGAQRPDGERQTDAEQAFERGHHPARVALAQRKSAAQQTANSGPEEPCGQQDAQRNFVAVEDGDQLAHQHDLADDGAESDQH